MKFVFFKLKIEFNLEIHLNKHKIEFKVEIDLNKHKKHKVEITLRKTY